MAKRGRERPLQGLQLPGCVRRGARCDCGLRPSEEAYARRRGEVSQSKRLCGGCSRHGAPDRGRGHDRFSTAPRSTTAAASEADEEAPFE